MSKEECEKCGSKDLSTDERINFLAVPDNSGIMRELPIQWCKECHFEWQL